MTDDAMTRPGRLVNNCACDEDGWCTYHADWCGIRQVLAGLRVALRGYVADHDEPYECSRECHPEPVVCGCERCAAARPLLDGGVQTTQVDELARQLAKAREDIRWLSFFVEPPMDFANEGDAAMWHEQRDAVFGRWL